MEVKRSITYLDGRKFGVDILPVETLEEGDQVRVGFEEGLLKRAECETNYGHIIIYTLLEE